MPRNYLTLSDLDLNLDLVMLKSKEKLRHFTCEKGIEMHIEPTPDKCLAQGDFILTAQKRVQILFSVMMRISVSDYFLDFPPLTLWYKLAHLAWELATLC